ncbi:uncharacterized protein LOC131437995 [Malaya genurostris]|uniref:uncharacterized protein LOC131437995 n=1 Tax=Malaya genurostris TaxID=325434 RepID=UPI0026F39765|nr:uncharacterized protein LOC131437995 [Malaya genurostris]
MTSRWLLFGLLSACGLALVTCSYGQSRSVIPFIASPDYSSRQGRDLLLSDGDDDFEFFNTQRGFSDSNPLADAKSVLEKLNIRHDGDNELPKDRVRELVHRLHQRSDQFYDVVYQVAQSTVQMLIAFVRLVEHSNDRFIIIAK